MTSSGSSDRVDEAIGATERAGAGGPYFLSDNFISSAAPRYV